jgi:tetracycline resistance efflux pump
MSNTWIVLLPPVLVLLIAIIWHNVIFALLAGIIAAAFIASDFSPIGALKLAIIRIYGETHIPNLYTRTESPDHLYSFVFLIALGIIISLITHTGGIAAYTQVIRKKLKSARSTETTALLISCFFFIDDYLNSLTVGSIMRPLTDKFHIPRAKLAFLLDSMSSSLCVLIPASSWVAMIITNLQTAGVTDQAHSDICVDPFNAYLHAIPFMFYPIFIMFTSWYIVIKNISFGPMYTQDTIAAETGNLFGGKHPLKLRISDNNQEGSLLDFFVPIGTFIAFVVAMILYSGQWHAFGGTRTLVGAFQQANIFYSLFVASLVALVVSIIFFRVQEKLAWSALKESFISGYLLMQNSLLVLLFAWTLSTLLKSDLQAGEFLAHLILGALPPLLLPVIIFLAATLISTSTGSAWGTIAVMTPLTIPLIVTLSKHCLPLSLENAYLLSPTVAALLSGSIAGCHISPISDSTVMSATSSGCYHIDHITTQFPYALTAIIGTICSYICAGLLLNASTLVSLAVSFSVGILVILAQLYLRNKKTPAA